MRVMLTGAAGFIGSHVARALVERGHDVHAVVRQGSSPERLVGLEDRLHIVHADLADPHQSAEAVESVGPEAALHAAWYVEPGKYLHAVPENLKALEMSTRLLRLLFEAECPRVVLVGTSFEPMAGGDKGGVQPPQHSIYRSAKAALHTLAERLAEGGAGVTCAHVFYLYGPGESAGRLVPALVRATLAGETIEVTDGKQRRDYLHVADVATALCALLGNETGPSVDVCSGAPLDVRELYDAVGGATGRRDLIRDGTRPYGEGEVLLAAGDDATLRSLGWAPAISLEEGITETVEWWRVRARLEGHRTQ